ncbi:MAG: hypothetical protein COX62_07225 [Deltaproteobacteria bacterium CG_4_10_14_0_2_um_filter_43_8]|nr:MAG: hypothetical protein COV46_07120 [Deltaproteobacteria bacterium CG11_big_fil_rev_8_21_14_0_20_49_13]PJA19147.1 MAG: hypothetical protein COX62_07225 [Deltaproteobacteria bacterium CG_4_10_14_0_2_um_filter_43_8]
MFWILLSVTVFFLFGAYLVLVCIRDRRYEKKSVAESMSDTVWDDIAREREENLQKARRFKDALSRAAQKR